MKVTRLARRNKDNPQIKEYCEAVQKGQKYIKKMKNEKEVLEKTS